MAELLFFGIIPKLFTNFSYLVGIFIKIEVFNNIVLLLFYDGSTTLKLLRCFVISYHWQDKLNHINI